MHERQVFNIFNPAKDLIAIQNLLIADKELLQLMGLNSADLSTKLKKIITESRWRDLATSETRLCIYFIPSRRMQNDIFTEEVIQVECHVPSSNGILANRILERIYKLLHKKQIRCKKFYFYNQLGELPTADGFYCCGSRFNTYTQI